VQLEASRTGANSEQARTPQLPDRSDAPEGIAQHFVYRYLRDVASAFKRLTRDWIAPEKGQTAQEIQRVGGIGPELTKDGPPFARDAGVVVSRLVIKQAKRIPIQPRNVRAGPDP
jgi:hypothetical protein